MEPIHVQSDEALCRAAGAGDREAEECLAARYNHLVRIYARPYFLAGGDSEDLIQEGMIGLVFAIRSFQSEKETGFRTYAETCIQNRIRSAVKMATRNKYAPLNHSISMISELLDKDSTVSENPEDVFIDREEWEKRKSALQSSLSGFEKVVLRLYLSGLSYIEIAEQTGKGLKSVDNAIQRIRRKAGPYFSPGDISES